VNYQKLLEQWPRILREEWPTGTFGRSPDEPKPARRRKGTSKPTIPVDPLAADHCAALLAALEGLPDRAEPGLPPGAASNAAPGRPPENE
jgi:hypothetical protein